MGRLFALLLALVSLWFAWNGIVVGIGVHDPVGQALTLVISTAYWIAAPLLFGVACLLWLLTDLVDVASMPPRSTLPDESPAASGRQGARSGAGLADSMTTRRHR